MSFLAPITGVAATDSATLGTAATDIVATAKKQRHIHQISLVNTSAAAVATTITRTDGTTTYTHMSGESIPANSRVTLTFEFELYPGWSLRGLAATGAVIQAHATYTLPGN